MTSEQETPAAWDVRDSDAWLDEHFRDRVAWATEHIPRAIDTYRIEFVMAGGVPFAFVYRYARDASGHKYAKTPGGEPTREPPVMVQLGALPPPELLAAQPA